MSGMLAAPSSAEGLACVPTCCCSGDRSLASAACMAFSAVSGCANAYFSSGGALQATRTYSDLIWGKYFKRHGSWLDLTRVRYLSSKLRPRSPLNRKSTTCTVKRVRNLATKGTACAKSGTCAARVHPKPLALSKPIIYL